MGGLLPRDRRALMPAPTTYSSSSSRANPSYFQARHARVTSRFPQASHTMASEELGTK